MPKKRTRTASKKTMPERIDEVLNGQPMKFIHLAEALYPDPDSWNYQSNGGPPGCFMTLSRVINRAGYRVSGSFLRDRTVHPRQKAVTA